jgi:alpha-N-acetylglucosaminidase
VPSRAPQHYAQHTDIDRQPNCPLPQPYQAYYELLQEAAFKNAPESNVTSWLIKRAHRRYGLVAAVDSDVASAWAGIAASGYSNNALVSDSTLVGKLFASDWVLQSWMGFESDRSTPKPALCREWKAWGSLLAAAARISVPHPATFTYDLVDLGREVLSQLTIPVGLNFTSSIGCRTEAACHSNFSLNVERITTTGEIYVALLRDLDKLLATDSAFLLGTWLQAARKLGGNATDCTDTVLGDAIARCPDFMEWNARAQITTWHPTDSPTNPTPPETNPTWPGTINDYARKQWAGLISTYYAERVDLYLKQALVDANLKHRRFNTTAVRLRQAKLAYEWQTNFGNIGSTEPTGDPVNVSTALRAKYSFYFAGCK